MSNSSKNGSIEISRALIGCIGAVLAAIIGGIFLLISTGAIRIELSSPAEGVDPQPTAVTQQPSPTQPAVTIATASPTTAVVVPTLNPTEMIGYQPSCNWTFDWELQPDGTYLWIGLPPGSANCQNVGQAGELLQRLRNGENLTLVVEVGDTPLGLSICSGNYTATTVTQGHTCVPSNPELWPKVTGTLRVTSSDGFLVGTGE